MSNTELTSLIETHLEENNNNNTMHDNLAELNCLLNNTHIQPQYSLNKKSIHAVEKIIGDKTVGGNKYFNVKWKNEIMTTWEPIENISRYTLQLYYLQKEVNTYNKNIDSPTHNVFMYIRTSRPQINDKQVSLEVQKSELMHYCQNNNIYIKGISMDEGTSARNMTNLEGLNGILSQIQPHDVLMVWDISRFSRNTAQALYLLEELFRKSIAVYFFKENLMYDGAMGKHHIRLALSSAQLHSDTVSEKVKAALQFKKSKGKKLFN